MSDEETGRAVRPGTRSGTNTIGSAPDRDRPLAVDHYAWPAAELDPVARMRALSAGLPHAATGEAVFEARFDVLWRFITDFERSTPRFEGTVGRIRVLERSASADAPDAETLRLEAKGPVSGPWQRFDVVLRPGWCLMQSRLGQVGMAARPENEATTRFFHFEGTRRLGRLARPLFAWNIRQDLRRLRNLLEDA